MIRTKTLPRMTVASKSYNVHEFSDEVVGEITENFNESLQKTKAASTNPQLFFTVFHVDEYVEADYHVELCQRVEKRGRQCSGIEFYELNESEAAFIVTSDGFEDLGKHYNALFEYMRNNGIQDYDHPRETYIDDPTSPNGYLIEISIPFSR